jgi:hypothetical protein
MGRVEWARRYPTRLFVKCCNDLYCRAPHKRTLGPCCSSDAEKGGAVLLVPAPPN